MTNVMLGFPSPEFGAQAWSSEPLTTVLQGTNIALTLPNADKSISLVLRDRDLHIGQCSTNRVLKYWEHIEHLDTSEENQSTQIFHKIHQRAVADEKLFLGRIQSPISTAFHNAGIAVLPSYRGKELGKSMVVTQIQLCRQYQMSTLFCETTNHYSAAIVQALGFTKIAAYPYSELADEFNHKPLKQLNDCFTVWCLVRLNAQQKRDTFSSLLNQFYDRIVPFLSSKSIKRLHACSFHLRTLLNDFLPPKIPISAIPMSSAVKISIPIQQFPCDSLRGRVTVFTNPNELQRRTERIMSSIISTKSIALLTCDGYEKYKKEDAAIIRAAKYLGREIESVIWNEPFIDWNKYKAVIVRSTWDYCKDQNLTKFFSVLRKIAQRGIKILNPLSTLIWNSHKSYLKDLTNAGISCIDTVFVKKENLTLINEILLEKRWTDCVIKPVVSAGGYNTFHFSVQTAHKIIAECQKMDIAEWMIQPFMQEVVEEGEWSFVMLRGKCVKTVLKKPAASNFLVNEGHGGHHQSVLPPSWMIRSVERISSIANSIHHTVYSRVDVIRRGETLQLMELEAIEPLLYFGDSIQLADAFCRTIFDEIENTSESHRSLSQEEL